ncbi:MAG: hotdog fold thioesterase [Desulfobacterales bacterium]
MDQKVKKAIEQAVKSEPFAQALNMQLVELGKGHSVVHMTYDPEKMNNIYARAHGGALFALIDEAFETAGQTDGTVAVALNVNVTYVSSPKGKPDQKNSQLRHQGLRSKWRPDRPVPGAGIRHRQADTVSIIRAPAQRNWTI